METGNRYDFEKNLGAVDILCVCGIIELDLHIIQKRVKLIKEET